MLLEHVLYSLRVHAGLSQAELADRAKLTPEYISMMENGKRVPRRAVLPRLVEALGDDAQVLMQAILADGSWCRKPRGTCIGWLLALLAGLSLGLA